MESVSFGTNESALLSVHLSCLFSLVLIFSEAILTLQLPEFNIKTNNNKKQNEGNVRDKFNLSFVIVLLIHIQISLTNMTMNSI